MLTRGMVLACAALMALPSERPLRKRSSSWRVGFAVAGWPTFCRGEVITGAVGSRAAARPAVRLSG